MAVVHQYVTGVTQLRFLASALPRQQRIGISRGLMGVVATFLAAPGLGIEATYWQAGLLTYMPPIVLAGLGIAASIRFGSVVMLEYAART